MPKNKARLKLTLMRIAAHDFNRALRVWKKTLPPMEILERFVDQQAKSLANMLRSFGFAVLGTIWLAANRPELSLKINIADITLPVAYVNFAVAALYFVALIHLTNYFALNEFIRLVSNKLFKFDSAWALTLLRNSESAWSGAWVNQFRFFSSSRLHRALGTSVLLLVSLPFLLLLFVGYWMVWSVGFEVMHREGLLSIPSLFTVIGWILVLSSIALALILFVVPFGFTKNASFIRWNFLYRMHRREGQLPPRVDFWLAEPEGH